MSIFSNLSNAFSFLIKQDNNYQSLSKKNDDLGVEDANIWIQANLKLLDSKFIQPNLRYQEIDQCARKIIDGLKKFPLTGSNLLLVRDHLLVIAKQYGCSLLKKYLIEHLSAQKHKINASTEVVRNLINDLICVYPNYASTAPSNSPPKDK